MSQQTNVIAITLYTLKNIIFKHTCMKSSKKQEVIDVFVNHRKDPKAKYLALVQVVLDLEESTPSQKRFYNASKYSPSTLNSLEYDILKICGIKLSEVKSAVRALKKAANMEVVINENDTLLADFKKQLEGIDIHTADYNGVLKPLSKNLSELLDKKPESQKKVDLIAFIESSLPKGPSLEDLKAELTKALTDAPNEVKEGLKLRDEFPFLDETDCPDEFKILVADKRTAYKNWKEGRDECKALLAAGVSNEELYEVASQTVKDFKLNLDIYDELNYYQEHKQILGKHPIFANKMLVEKVEAMSTIDLGKRQKNLRTYVSRDEKTLNKMEEGEAKTAFAKKVQDWKDELELVDARLEKIS